MRQLTIRRSFYVYLIIAVLTTSGALRGQDATPPERADSASAASPVRIDTPLCRILDSAVQPPRNAAEQSARIVNFRVSRCSNLVSPSATALVLRVTSVDRSASDAATGAPESSSRTLPMPANGELDFVVPSGRDIAVDLEAYILPPGVWIPKTSSTSATAPTDATASASGRSVLRVGTNGLVDGSAGRLDLTGHMDDSTEPAGDNYYTWAGAVLDAFSTTGNTGSDDASVVARIGTTDSDSGFAVHASNDSRLMIMRGSGMLELPPSGFLNGRSDYYGTPGSKIAGNVVHDVTVTDPLDADGVSDADSHVVFFKAHSTSESTSPAMTRFEAYSNGFWAPPQISFDSKFYRHRPQHYHFRAYATFEKKDTFWVKPGTNGSTTTTDTRADMYVSGLAGIGAFASTVNVLNIARHQDQMTTLRISNGGSDAAGATNTNASVGIRLAEGATEKAAFVSLGSLNTAIANAPANALLVWNYATAPTLFSTAGVERVRIGADGNVGIGTNAPTVKLDVNGAARVATTLTVAGAVSSGNLTVTGNIVTTGDVTGARVFNAVFQDVAEWVPATADLAPGTVVVLNTSKNNEVMASHAAYDTSVAGVVSEQPGLLLGVGAANKEMVATTGRVKVRVDARQSPVRVGDLLVTSEVAGTAMRSEPMDVNGRKFHQPGTIIGKALEPLEGGLGEILVLLSMQ